MKVHAIKGHIKSQFHWYYQHFCSECECLHWYRKYGKPEDRYDGRKIKHMCFENRSIKIMNADILKPLVGHDVGIQKDMFGNESIYITKSKGVIIRPTLDDMLKETELLKSLRTDTAEG